MSIDPIVISAFFSFHTHTVTYTVLSGPISSEPIERNDDVVVAFHIAFQSEGITGTFFYRHHFFCFLFFTAQLYVRYFFMKRRDSLKFFSRSLSVVIPTPFFIYKLLFIVYVIHPKSRVYQYA